MKTRVAGEALGGQTSLPCGWVPSLWASASPPGAEMADLKNILDAVALTHAFTVTLDWHDSLGTGQATRVTEVGSQSRLRAKELLLAHSALHR